MEIHNRIVYGDVYWIDLDGLDQNRGGIFHTRQKTMRSS